MNQIQKPTGKVEDASPSDGNSQPVERLKIYNAVIQKVDIPNARVGDPFYRTSEADIKEYLTGLFKDILKHSRSQTFELQNSSVVGALVAKLASVNFKTAAAEITKRLLDCEVKVQATLGNFTTVKSGSLLCAHFELDDNEFILVVKIDHAGFLNEDTLKRASGLPEKHRAQKCATFKVVGGVLEETAIVTDSAPSITEYWWNTYLTLTPLSTPEVNTVRAFTAIEGLLANKVKPKSKSDYWTLRNALVGYFTTREQCSYPDMVQELFGAYKPDNPELSMPELVAEANRLPSRRVDGFDTLFQLAPSVINAKIKRQIRLRHNVDLRITGEVTNIEKVFSTGEDSVGKYLKIYSDEGYAAFHRTDDDDNERETE
ncbi:nucleoid-associated protein [Pseudomonas viridiflava]|uniref:nucleoid-associated protein n=1 Tax=Pseudomonas viridiflava TaxID=33069 RepID=UPI0013C35343|nr:nucleoid-associated protein [Pseudomonas viridiflava]